MKGLKKLFTKHGTRWCLSLIITLLACAQTLGYLPSTELEQLDTYFYDLRIKIQPTKMDQRIVIVDIDEKSLSEVGRFPWSRNLVADLVTKLTDHYHAKAVGFDIQFSEPDTSSGYTTLETLAKTDLKNLPSFKNSLKQLKPKLDYDAQLALALKNKPIILGYTFSDQIQKGLLPKAAFYTDDLRGRNLNAKQAIGYEANIPQLQNAASAAGFFNAEVDQDGVMRSAPLLIRFNDGFYESLALATAKVALGANTIRPEFLPDTDQSYGVLAALILNTKPHEKRIPVEDLIKIQINYQGIGGPKGGSFAYISATDVLHERVPIANLEQRIVLVGTSAVGLQDLRTTPLNNQYPGVEAHANLIASILDNNFKQNPDYSDALNLVQMILISTLLIVGLSLFTPLLSILYTLVITIALIKFNFWAYQEQGLVLPIAMALVLILVLFIFNFSWGYWFEVRQSRAMANLFGEYVAPELVKVMAEDPNHYSMQGEKRVLTILFADVRDFTSISETLEANDLREYINLFLTAMSNDIQRSRGTLDKYIGDCVMAFWGAPVYLSDHAFRAVATALTMQQTINKLNDYFRTRNWPSLKMGIGLNTGEVRVGDMGSKIRRAYTVMGDPVNVASRLEAITKKYRINIAVGELTQQATPEFAYRKLERLRVKGKNEAITIFEPIGLKSELNEAMRIELENWHNALALFYLQKWEEARIIIQALHEQYPQIQIYELTLNYIKHYHSNPPAIDWDGVITY